MHFAGFLGMPRRIYTYEADRGWGTLNLICTIGVAFQIAGVLIMSVNVWRSLRKGKRAGQRSLGCLDPRVEHKLTAPGVQFR